MNRETLAAINAAGEALRNLDMGAVRLRYRPADHLITRDTYQFTIDAGDRQALSVVGCGDTPEAALFEAMAQILREAA